MECWSRFGVGRVCREVEAEGMSVNREGGSRTVAMFWSWKGRGANEENKRK